MRIPRVQFTVRRLMFAVGDRRSYELVDPVAVEVAIDPSACTIVCVFRSPATGESGMPDAMQPPDVLVALHQAADGAALARELPLSLRRRSHEDQVGLSADADLRAGGRR